MAVSSAPPIAPASSNPPKTKARRRLFPVGTSRRLGRKIYVVVRRLAKRHRKLAGSVTAVLASTIDVDRGLPH